MCSVSFACTLGYWLLLRNCNWLAICSFLLFDGNILVFVPIYNHALAVPKSLRKLEFDPLCFFLHDFGSLFHQENARPRFLYKMWSNMLTWIVWVLGQFFHPLICDDNSLFFRVVISHLKSLFLCFSDDIEHILIFQSTHDTEEKRAFWQLPR